MGLRDGAPHRRDPVSGAVLPLDAALPERQRRHKRGPAGRGAAGMSEARSTRIEQTVTAGAAGVLKVQNSKRAGGGSGPWLHGGCDGVFSFGAKIRPCIIAAFEQTERARCAQRCISRVAFYGRYSI